ncbi:DUF4959 domain-containing protein [Pedobacter nyackensis]|uniref:DUF4959 domain-containing protein n=1 Tax=Pedobacter nyackensis TaxID=475255 RepID=UPI002931DE5F|nr:DUF4959 domain-containing protein [Pedobacter nyackensis]
MKKIVIFLSYIALFIVGCRKGDEYKEPISTDQTKPAAPGNIRVKNFEGGAYIIYDLPTTKNTLYVLADYVINEETGIKRQTKTSYYTDTVKVEGFALSKEYKVKLTTVSRANVLSDPIEVTVHPEQPAYLAVAENITLNPTFGGVNARSKNPSGQGITLVYLYDDPTFGKYVIREQKYVDALEINYSLRGFDTTPKKFGMYVTDRFGNKSTVKYATIEPWYEILLDKSKFSAYILPSDNPIYLGAFPLKNMWDNITSGVNFWHTAETLEPYPHIGTFSLGQEARLSRFIFHQRNSWEGAYWANGTAEKFTLWGSNSAAPRDQVLPVSAPEGTVLGDWVNLGNFDFPLPPSGNPIIAPTAGDIQWWTDGTEFHMPVNTPLVKFLRIAINKSWGNHPATYVCELTFYGGQK